MPFVSRLLNRSVRDGRGEVVGKLTELYVDQSEAFPSVVAIGLQRGNQTFQIAAVDIAQLDDDNIVLRERLRDLAIYEPRGAEIGLAGQVLDRQIIDINGRRVVRVHDLQLARTNGHYRLVGIDPTPRAMLRRIGLEAPVEGVLRAVKLGRALGDGCIPWNQLDPVAIGPAGIPLKNDLAELKSMHPADLADIVEQLDQTAGGYILTSLDAEAAAEMLQEVEPESQASLMEHLDTERAADILEHMDPDDAADILGDLSEDRANELLEHMQPEEAADVRELLAYPEESAGGLMTTDFGSLAAELTAAEAIDRLRKHPDNYESHYLYIIDEDEVLHGVISLSDLITAAEASKVETFMETQLITVHADESQENLAVLLSKYDLLAVPVVDEENRMLGVVTVDDVLDSLVPADWKRRAVRA